jgi:hypothetical protein
MSEMIDSSEALRLECTKWSDAMLRRAILSEKTSYTDAALSVLRAELHRRAAGFPPTVRLEREIRCTRCALDLTFAGTKRFHEGPRWGILGELGELFVNKERFDVYYCGRCGKVEFFVDGVGEDMRPQ